MRVRESYTFRGWSMLDKRVNSLKKIDKTIWQFITKEGEVLDTVDLKMFNLMPPCPKGTVIFKQESDK